MARAQFKDRNGNTHVVNTGHVVQVVQRYEGDDAECSVELSNGEKIPVDGTAENWGILVGDDENVFKITAKK